MKAELYNYSIYPIVFPEGKEVTLTIRPLGAHAAFAPKAYTIYLLDIDDWNSDKNIRIPVVPDEDGCIRFKTTFYGEKEHYVKVTELANKQDQTVVQLSVYSLAEDLASRLPLRGDLHVHSNGSDGRQAPDITAANYRGWGYDFMAITDHHRYYPSLRAMRALKDIPSMFNLVPGEEVHLPGTDVHLVNFGGLYSINGLLKEKEAYTDVHGDPNSLALEGNPPYALTPEEFRAQIEALAQTLDIPDTVDKTSYTTCVWAFDRIREADGLGIFAHPYWLWRVFNVSDPFTRLMMENAPFDAFEVLGGENYYQQNGYQTALYYEEWKKGRVHPIVGSTDSHNSLEHNRNATICSTIVFSPANERKALITSIKEKYSVAVDTISKEYRLVGEERFQRYACFLMDNWFPLHDRYCAQEGFWMNEYLSGNTDAGTAMAILKKICSATKALYDRYFILT